MADTLPTIKQIMDKADSLRNVPMDDDEARAWFEWTVAENGKRTTGGRDDS